MLLALVLAVLPAWVDARYENLEARTPVELFYLRNEIFARHGRTFESARLQARFEREPWYSANPEYSDDLLSAEERSLVGRIVALEAVDALLEKARGQVPAGVGIAAGIGNVILGRASPAEPFGVESFIGLPGRLGEVRTAEGAVTSTSFVLSPEVSGERVEPKVRSFLTRYVGFEPRQSGAAWTWASDDRVLSLSRGPDGLLVTIASAP